MKLLGYDMKNPADVAAWRKVCSTVIRNAALYHGVESFEEALDLVDLRDLREETSDVAVALEIYVDEAKKVFAEVE
jgi:hypothetical protein